jgi:hypothetical protein
MSARTAALWTLLLAGCGGTVATSINTEGDVRRVSDVVEAFNETRTNAKKSEPLFAQGAMPKGADFKKYADYSFMTTETARPTGDTATMEVSVRNEKTGDAAGKVEWTFKKEADAWKIEKAPLP